MVTFRMLGISTFKGLVVQEQFQLLFSLVTGEGHTVEEGSLQQAVQEAGEGTKVWRGVPLLAKSRDAPGSEGSPELRLRVYRCLLLSCLAEGTAYTGGYRLLLAGSQGLQR